MKKSPANQLKIQQNPDEKLAVFSRVRCAEKVTLSPSSLLLSSILQKNLSLCLAEFSQEKDLAFF
jgi:hypothetical protein